MTKQPKLAMWDPWKKELKRSKTCPSKEPVKIDDVPSAPLMGDGTLTILFAIKVISAPGCPCTPTFRQVFARVTLEVKGGEGVGERPFDMLDEIPTPPGLPPGWPKPEKEKQ